MNLRRHRLPGVPADDVRAAAYAVLDRSWRPDEQFCPPNQRVYPHQWLWDSCFHAIAWTALGDGRGQQELASCLRAQLPSGFVPHMRYLRPNRARGPLRDRSSYTQPPIYVHAARVLAAAGRRPDAALIEAMAAALEWLWSHRMSEDGLLFIVHPWESGADDSPRWDSWVGRPRYQRRAFRRYDAGLVRRTVFDREGAAVWSNSFVAAPAAFNAFAAHAAHELAALRDDPVWAGRGLQLAAAIDGQLWDERQGLWRDLAIVGGGPSVHEPTLDGVFPALVTADETRAWRALSLLLDPSMFRAPYGLRYLPTEHRSYEPDAYWRGPAWPQLNYMAHVAARRWGCGDIADAVAAMTVRGATRSGFSEFWNAETGSAGGATPQGWSALAAAFEHSA